MHFNFNTLLVIHCLKESASVVLMVSLILLRYKNEFKSCTEIFDTLHTELMMNLPTRFLP